LYSCAGSEPASRDILPSGSRLLFPSSDSRNGRRRGPQELSRRFWPQHGEPPGRPGRMDPSMTRICGRGRSWWRRRSRPGSPSWSRSRSGREAREGFNADVKVGCLVAGMIGRADSINDMNLLRRGATETLSGGIRALSTLGSHLRSAEAVAERDHATLGSSCYGWRQFLLSVGESSLSAGPPPRSASPPPGQDDQSSARPARLPGIAAL
jgi:hypothetical protein